MHLVGLDVGMFWQILLLNVKKNLNKKMLVKNIGSLSCTLLEATGMLLWYNWLEY